MKMTLKLFTAALLALGVAAGAQAQTAAITQPFTITVTVTPALASVNLSNTAITTLPNNAGTVVGALSCVTNPPGGTCTAPIVLGGADASKFALTNGGMLPSNLVVGAANIPAGTYNISLTATK